MKTTETVEIITRVLQEQRIANNCARQAYLEIACWDFHPITAAHWYWRRLQWWRHRL